ncbi:MAG TPA: DUF547 domain-containing protein [Thermoanaerobaculia bacterium]|nr:DUF547 domain-containing protein [Thermoanaerobaculia bacterium]
MHRKLVMLFLPVLFVVAACSKPQQKATVLPPVQPGAIKGEPDYGPWSRLLAKHYDPNRGMNYSALKQDDSKTLNEMREKMASVDVASLNHDEQFAFWLNYYNMSVVGKVVDHYPIGSIKDLSTDLVKRLNVFDQKDVRFGNGTMSLNDIENSKIREVFKDPRVHFAINCAAKSCPTIRPEPFDGKHVKQQLDDQVKTFLNGPKGARVEGGKLHVTKVLDWFKSDFDQAGGRAVFLKKYLSPEKVAVVSDDSSLVFDDYSWDLNDWKS